MISHTATADAAPELRPWLPHWQVGHARAATAALVVGVAAAVLAPPGWAPGVAVQLAVLAAAVAVFGVPHGALDPLVGRRWLARRLGPRWWAPFHTAYVLLAAGVVAGWALAPAATLAAFLIASAVHFGLGDVARQRAPGGRLGRAAEVLVRGAAPVAVPALVHPAAVRQAFTWVAAGAAPPALDHVVAALASAARWAVLPGCLLFAAAHALAAVSAARRRDVAPLGVAHAADAVECLAVPALALALPPFLAFLAYFCLLHSARHAMELAAALAPSDPRRAWARFARAALPATLATLALGAVAWLALRGAHTAPAPATARVLFAGLAALTAPHMLLTALAGHPHATHDDAAR